ncbi:MAG: hypothetical protein ABIT05_04600 [Chitinophagaceae bacterium]
MRSLLLSLLLAGYLCCAAQNEATRSTTRDHKKILVTRFGFKGGYNRSVINGRETATNAKTGYIGDELYGAFFCETRLKEKLSFENELLVSWTDNYHFIEIPLHLKYHFTAKWTLFAGPKIDFIADNDNDPNESGYRFRNLGASGELGLQYNIRTWLLLESRYSKGFVEQVDDLSFDINDGKRNTFRIGAGIRF